MQASELNKAQAHVWSAKMHAGQGWKNFGLFNYFFYKKIAHRKNVFNTFMVV